MKQLYLLPILLFLFLSSCKEEDTPTPVIDLPVENEPPCLLLSRVFEGNGFTNTSTFDYDATRRLKTVEGGGFTSSYERNSEGKVNKIAYKKGTESKGQTDFEFDAEGRWVKATRNGNMLVTELEYDSQGRLIASTFTVNLTQTPSVQRRSFEYEDGTLLKQTMVIDGGPTEVTEYEYYTDKPAVVFEYDSINYLLQGEPVPSKYLMKKSFMTRLSDDGYKVVDNISYELNKKGYPTLTTHHVVQSTNSPAPPTEYTNTFNHSYNCE